MKKYQKGITLMLLVSIILQNFAVFLNYVKAEQVDTGNVSVVISTEQKNQGGDDKLDYWSGEQIHAYATLNVSGNGYTLNNPKAILKIKKQHVQSDSQTPIFLKAESAREYRIIKDDPDYFIVEYDYDQLVGGQNITVPFFFKMQNRYTPNGFETPITFEIRSNTDEVVATTTKTFVTKTKPVESIKIIDEIDKVVNDHHISTKNIYVNKGDHVNGFNSMITYRVGVSTKDNLEKDDIGNYLSANQKIIFKLPVGAIMNGKAREDGKYYYYENGWTYDQATHTATYEGTLESLNYIHVGKYGYDYLAAKIQLYFPNHAYDTVYTSEATVIADPGTEHERELAKRTGRVQFHRIESEEVEEPEVQAQGSSSGSKSPIHERTGKYHYLTPSHLDPDSLPIEYILRISNSNNGKVLPTTNEVMYSKFSEIVDYDLDPRLYYSRIELPSTLPIDDLTIVGIREDSSEQALPINNRTVVIDDVNDEYKQIVFRFSEPIVVNNTSFEIKVDALLKENVWQALKANQGWGSGREIRLPNFARFTYTKSGNFNEMITDTNEAVAVVRKEFLQLGHKATREHIVPHSDNNVRSVYTTLKLHGEYSEQFRGRDLILNNVKSISLLPPGIEYVRTVTTGVSEPEVVANYKNTAKTAVIYSLNNVSAAQGDRQISFEVNTTISAAEGVNRIDHMYTWGNNDEFRAKNDAGVIDTLDLDNDGDRNETFTGGKTDITFITPRELITRKHVSLDQNVWSLMTHVVPGTEIYYKISIHNNSVIRQGGLSLLDVLPYVGDHSISPNSTGIYPDRESVFAVNLASSLESVAANTEILKKWDVWYSTDAQGDTIEATRNATFVPAASIADFTQVKLIKLKQKAGVLMDVRETNEFVIHARAPQVELIPGSKANNSIAFSTNDTNYLEGNIATIIVPGLYVSGTVFADYNKNGKQDRAEIGLGGYTVRLMNADQTPAIGLDGIAITGTTNEVGQYTLIAPKGGEYYVIVEKKDGNENFTKLYESNGTYQPGVGNDTTEDNGVGKTTSGMIELNKIHEIVRNAAISFEKRDFTATKIWVNGPAEKPTITLILQQNGVDMTVPDARKELEDGTTEVTWTDLPTSDALGNDYVYSVREEGVPDYKTTYDNTGEVVTNTYTKGTVTVRYLDISTGSPIVDDEVMVGNLGENYSTNQKTFATHEYVRVDGRTTGMYLRGGETVTYWYNPSQSRVTARYVDEYDNELASSVETNGLVTTPYTTEQKNIPHYNFVRVEGKPTGQITKEEQLVTYVYKGIPSVVNHHYRLADGTVLGDETEHGHYGEGYYQDHLSGTYDHEYEYVRTEGAPQQKKFASTPLDITYIYRRRKETVRIKYVNEQRQTIAPDDTQEGYREDSFTTQAKEINGYELVSSPTQDGTYGSDRTITYVYRLKDGKQQGAVTAEYVTNTGFILEGPVPTAGLVGDNYSTEQKTFSRYHFVRVEGDTTGQYSATPKTVKYIYRIDSGYGELLIRHVNEDGEEIFNSEYSKGADGEGYYASDRPETGLIVVRTEGDPNGVYRDGELVTVTFVYRGDDVQVPIQYIDYDIYNETGRKANIIPSESFTSQIGKSYDVSPKAIPNYQFVISMEMAPKGKLDSNYVYDQQPIVFAYRKLLPATLVVKHVDEADQEVSPEVRTTGNAGDPYTTAQATPANYELLRVEGNANGTYTNGEQVVKYVYRRQTGTVVVKHVDEADQEVSPEVRTTGNAGEQYTTAQAIPANYEFVRVEGNAIGTYANGEQVVKYVYRRQTGTVVVKHVDEAGQEVASEVRMNGNAGDQYTTAQATPANYELLRVEGNANGTYTNGEQVVKYVYRRQTGSVVVKHVDEADQEVASEVRMNGNAGDQYTTSQATPANYEFVRVEGNANGNYTNGEQIVKYVYRRQTGTVVVKHVDEADQEVVPEVRMNGNAGDQYTTTQATPANYEFVRVEGNANGNYTNGEQVVKYVYRRQTGTIEVKYVDESDTEIAPAETQTGEVGANYTTVQKDIDGYEFVQVAGQPAGTFTKDVQIVKYVYRVKPTPATSTVTIQYVDEAGQPIAPAETTTGAVGTNYTIEVKAITGYTHVRTDGQANGMITNDPQTVTYVYRKDTLPATSTVTIQYVDETGQPIAPAETKSGTVGTNYTSEAKAITGYTLVRTDGQANGTITNDPQVVTYVYQANRPTMMGTVTVKYLDELGNVLVPEEVQTDEVGKPYMTTQKVITGYTFVRTEGMPTGTYGVDGQTVVYIYQADTPPTPLPTTSTVTIQYVDEAGQPIAPAETKSGTVGTNYTSEAKAITGYTHVRTDGQANGTITNDPQVVTYVYQADTPPTPLPTTSTVTIQYVDEAGQPIAPAETTTGTVGTNYTSEAKVITGYTHVRTDGQTNGTITNDPQVVTYVYRVDAPATQGRVIVEFVDETGKVLATQEVTEGEVGNPYATIPAQIEGYEVIRIDGAKEGTITDSEQHVRYVYRPITSTPNPDPAPKIEPEKPATVTSDNSTKVSDSQQTVQAQATNKTPETNEKQLPNTGSATEVFSFSAMVFLMLGSGLAFVAKKREV